MVWHDVLTFIISLVETSVNLFYSEYLEKPNELFVIHSEIKQHHSDIKDAFADPKMVKIVLNYLDFLLEKSNSAEAVKTMQMADHEKILDVIKMTVTLVRNILHIPTPRLALNLTRIYGPPGLRCSLRLRGDIIDIMYRYWPK